VTPWEYLNFQSEGPDSLSPGEDRLSYTTNKRWESRRRERIKRERGKGWDDGRRMRVQGWFTTRNFV